MAKKSTTPFKDIITLLNNHKTRTKQLLDGHVFIYNREFLMASFYYYGGSTISRLVLNTKKYIGHSFYSSLNLIEEYLSGGDALCLLLKEKFPKASECNEKMAYAYEFSIVEWLLNDPASMVEFIPSRFGYDFSIVNIPANTSCSFRYVVKGKEIKKLWLRYHSRVKTVKVERIIIPRCRWDFMDQLIDRSFNPIVD